MKTEDKKPDATYTDTGLLTYYISANDWGVLKCKVLTEEQYEEMWAGYEEVSNPVFLWPWGETVEVPSEHDAFEEARGQEVLEMIANKAWRNFDKASPAVEPIIDERNFLEMCILFAEHIVRPPHHPNSWPNCIHTQTHHFVFTDEVQLKQTDVGKFLHDSGRKDAARLLEAADTNDWEHVRDVLLPMFQRLRSALSGLIEAMLSEHSWPSEEL